MQTLRQQVGNWLLQDENKIYNDQKNSLSDKDLMKGHKKCLKDLNVKVDVLDFPIFRTHYKAGLRGAFKLKVHTTAKFSQEIAVSDIELKVWKPGDDKFDTKMFETWKTGKGIDVILSNKGGAAKASTTIITGGPGVGKTTVCADIQKCFQDNYPDAKICCVQSEMKKFDIAYEFHQNDMPWMGDIKYLLLKEYGYENIKNTLIKIFTSGYDCIFLDSIENIVQKLKVYADMTKKEAESFMLELFDNANDGKNNTNEKGEKVYTFVLAVQQVTKGGEFVGDNALKHETTAMLELILDEMGNRCMYHSKNRRCGKHIYKKMYYDLDTENNNTVKYDLKAFEEIENQKQYVKEEKEKMKEMSEGFTKLFERSVVKNDKDVSSMIDEAFKG